MKKLLLVLLLLTTINLLAVAPDDPDASWRSFFDSQGKNWKVHYTARHTLASMYGLGAVSSSSADKAASEFLNDYAALLGVSGGIDLRLTGRETGEDGSHLYYQQYYSGLPVVGAELAIHLDRANRLMAVNSGLAPDIRPSLDGIVSRERALATASRFPEQPVAVSGGELVLLPGSPAQARPAWRFVVEKQEMGEPGSWLVYVDAQRPNMVLRTVNTFAKATGSALIYKENPVVTPSMSKLSLPNMDASTSLFGNYVKVYDANSNHDVGSPIVFSDYTTAKESNRQYNYDVTDARFSEAMAYYHINRVHDQWRSFGFTKLNGKAPVFVNVASKDGGPGYDNAYYTRNSKFKTGVYVFGAGNLLQNLSHDADTYYHEYGHGVLDHIKSGYMEAIESDYPGSFHEAFGDISAAAITGNSKIGEYGLKYKSGKFVGRDINNTMKYPQNVIEPKLHEAESHWTSQIVSGAWWDLKKKIGVSKAQKLLYKAASIMPSEMTFFDLRDALMTEDQSLYGGADSDEIQSAFALHGLGGQDPGQPGTLKISGLKTALYNSKTGKITLKSTFKKGDIIVVLANYTASSNLTPAFNIIPVDASYSGPGLMLGFKLLDEAVKGSHTGLKGAWQVALYTFSFTSAGSYSVSVQSRLGGTHTYSPNKTVHFKIK